MIDLFRFVEHDFAVPAAADPIEIENRSDFQTGLAHAATGKAASERVRALALRYRTAGQIELFVDTMDHALVWNWWS